MPVPIRRVAALACSLALTGAGTSSAADPPSRYALAGGCFTVTADGAPVAESAPLRLQPTRLGEYLLYTPQRRFVTADGTSSERPSPAAEWRAGDDLSLTNVASGRRLTTAFTPATGCADYPEAAVGASGTPARGLSASGEVTGTIDTHGHLMGFELFGGDFHCGRPWHPYGVAFALPDCSTLWTGTNGAFASTFDTGAPVSDRDPRGWPTFRDWPRPDARSTEGDYWTGLMRAWMGGLRILVSLSVDNEPLCLVMTQRRAPCDDMVSARRQIRDLHELQDYIDAQAGGPGKGFFRIVTDPVQARTVVNQGKLAVVVGIEVSRILGCGEHLGTADCDRARVDAGLQELRELGVTSFFPVHKFDNAFGGTKMDPGTDGAIVGAGNIVATGHPWQVQTCPTELHDNDQPTIPYPPTPHCNTRGLSELGRHLIERMVDRRFLVELDHMDAKTADAALGVLEQRGYSGVVSGHSTASQLSPQLMPRIYRLGGFVAPVTNPSPQAFLDIWSRTIAARNGPFFDGGGYGSDMNGLAPQSQPGDATGDRIAYPFRSLDGDVTFDRERWGQRVFDVNRDGVANYGMYPDWLEQVVRRGGEPVRRDLLRGAEAYLQMWERAYGIAPARCRPAGERLTGRGLGTLRLGRTAEQLLLREGQPAARPGRSYRYCVSGSRAGVRVVFDARGRTVLVARTGDGPVRRGSGVIRRMRAGRVAWTAAVAASQRRRPARLRADLRAAGLR